MARFAVAVNIHRNIMSRGAAHLADESSSDRKWFRTTQWNVVLSTGDANCSTAAEAREKLCAIYWTPLYNFVCRWGHNSEDAKDLTQSFFAKLIEKEKDTLSVANPGACREKARAAE